MHVCVFARTVALSWKQIKALRILYLSLTLQPDPAPEFRWPFPLAFTISRTSRATATTHFCSTVCVCMCVCLSACHLCAWTLSLCLFVCLCLPTSNPPISVHPVWIRKTTHTHTKKNTTRVSEWFTAVSGRMVDGVAVVDDDYHDESDDNDDRWPVRGYMGY